MASVKQTVRDALLRSPLLFPEPVNVLEFLFAITHTGCYWQNGEVMFDQEYPSPECMDHSDLERAATRRAANIKEMIEEDPELATHFQMRDVALELQDKVKRLRRGFMEENMEDILQSPLSHTYFSSHQPGPHMLKGVIHAHCLALNFPPDIQPDWAAALYGFVDYWVKCLNSEYASDADDVKPWPEAAKDLHGALLSIREPLYPLAHNGRSYEDYRDGIRQIIEALAADRARIRPG